MYLVPIEAGIALSMAPITLSNFYLLNKSTSFTTDMKPEEYEPFGYGVFEFSPEPQADPLHRVVQELPIRDEEGVYRQQWRVEALAGDERAEAVKALRARKWEEIKTERERRKAGGVKVGANWFHSDETSRTQYSILDAKAMRAGWPDSAIIHPKWKSMDRNADGSPVYVPMTVALLRQILDAGIAQEGVLFDRAEAHRVAMEAYENPLDYAVGQDEQKTRWPLVYGE